MAKREAVQQWWDGLDSDEQAAAEKAEKSGRLDGSTRKSLESAGLIDSSTSDDEEVVKVLKMRH